jgi:tRNA(fMet)-specific endonuclease VapC
VEPSELLIDTSIIIEHLRKTDKSRSILFNITETTSLFVSSVTVFELKAGATDTAKQNDVDTILDGIAVLPFDIAAADEAGKLYRELNATNRLIEIRDIFIAATARANGLPIMTLNHKHFERVKGLKIIPEKAKR